LTLTFAELGIPHNLAEFLDELGFTTPFEVQTATIPDAIAGRDIAARAPTGSGKTLAFGLPLLMRVEGALPRRPLGLVLAPTRELAEQIRRDLEPIAHAGGRSVEAVYGGVGYERQRRALARGVDVLIACPGRLSDLVGRGDVDLGSVEVVVIDEADRMADVGFLPEVRRLLDRVPNDRQTLLYSATLDGEVGALTREYQRDPVRAEIGDEAPDIEAMRHFFWRLPPADRIDLASRLIAVAGPTIVFCRTRRGADRVAKQLARAGTSGAAIHGSRTQGQRDRALRSFVEGRVEALIATDVAARGIHVDGVACVIHFDPPVDSKTYVHRSGRTARAGAEGLVVSLLAHDQLRDANRSIQQLRLRAAIDDAPSTSSAGIAERLGAPIPDRPSEQPKGNRGSKDSGSRRSEHEQTQGARNGRGSSGGRRRGRRAGNGGTGEEATAQSRSTRAPRGGSRRASDAPRRRRRRPVERRQGPRARN
jgi:superfamily II DNA/RNA helicase